jgi:hypothetical protein
MHLIMLMLKLSQCPTVHYLQFPVASSPCSPGGSGTWLYKRLFSFCCGLFERIRVTALSTVISLLAISTSAIE